MIPSTSNNNNETEFRNIQSINNLTKIITLNETLKYNHSDDNY